MAYKTFHALVKIIVISLFCANAVSADWKQKQSKKSAAASTETTSKTDQPEPITITDDLGRTITIKRKIERIVFTHYTIAEAVKILDAWNMVVGRDSFTSDTVLFPRLDEIPKIAQQGKSYEPDYELIFSLNVDLVIVNTGPQSGIEEMIKTLEPEIRVVALQFNDPGTVCENLEKLGKLLDKKTEAAGFIDWHKDLTHMLSQKTSVLTASEKPKILYKTGWGKAEELMTMTDSYQWSHERNRLTGCVNIAADLPSAGGWVQSIDPEWLVMQTMDVLVIGDPVPGGFGLHIDDNAVIVRYRQDVMNLSVFSGSEAVKNKRVYMLATSFFGTARSIVGFVYMAKWFHPELFRDLDPQAIHQEYISKFMRVDFNLSEHGVLVYPEE